MTEQQQNIFKRLLSAKTQKDRVPIGLELIRTLHDDNRPHFNNKSLQDIDGESWINIPNYELAYQISNFGRIKSYYRISGKPRIILAGKIDDGGYIMVTLSKKGKSERIRIQTLMVRCFYKNKLLDGHHDNGIKIDNRLTNVKCVTRSENIKHAWDTGLNKGGSFIYGVKRYNAILTDELVFKIKIMIKNGEKSKNICEKLGVNMHTYKNIRYKGAWPHIKV